VSDFERFRELVLVRKVGDLGTQVFNRCTKSVSQLTIGRIILRQAADLLGGAAWVEATSASCISQSTRHMLTPSHTRRLESIQGMDNYNHLAFVWSQIIASSKPHLLFGLGIHVGILNVTSKHVDIIQSRNEKEQPHAVP
jgi:hypothetical protein